MKILAVIPARAGSKGIPNKNIRIINGKPLISYCIENALKSRFITDIIITTDSAEIELIANYYSVPVKRRREELCHDNVTLDAVIYDACRDIPADYVITMQPTSPTLNSATLDDAIQYAVENDLDTVISAINSPHLAWVEREGKVIPDYTERLNRQYLPKRFLETGSFVISRYDVVSSSSRIGKKVDIYEISDKEAIDIDDFRDLLCAEQILREQKMAIVVNGNNQIGMGHVCRMMELADLFYDKPDIYFDSRVTEREVFGATTYKLTAYRNEEDLIEKLSAGKYQLIINDILDTDEAYMDRIRRLDAAPKIVNFEDLGSGRKRADLVINALYDETEGSPGVRCGERYYLAPKLFLLYKPIEIRTKAERVFICFGGADPQNYTDKLLSFIEDECYSFIKFTIVLGKAKQNIEEIVKRYQKSNIEIWYDVKNMPELMAGCDIAITSRGRTCYELAMLGIPTIAMAQNAREERHGFVCKENGFEYLGKNIGKEQMKDALDKMIKSSHGERKVMQEKMLQHNLKDGRRRVKNLIDSI